MSIPRTLSACSNKKLWETSQSATLNLRSRDDSASQGSRLVRPLSAPGRDEATYFFGAIEIDGFIDKDELKKQIDEWIRVFRITKPAPRTSGPLIPGDPRKREKRKRSQQKGIPLLKPVVDDLLDISKRTGIAFKER